MFQFCHLLNLDFLMTLRISLFNATGFARSLEKVWKIDFSISDWKKSGKTVLFFIFNFKVWKKSGIQIPAFWNWNKSLENKITKNNLFNQIHYSSLALRNFNSPDESRTENMIIVYSIASFLVRDHMTSHVS